MSLSDFTEIKIPDLMRPVEKPKFLLWYIGFGPPETRWVCDVVAACAPGDRWELALRVQAESPESALKLSMQTLADL